MIGRIVAQALEQLIANLLGAAAHQFGMKKAHQQDGFLFAHDATCNLVGSDGSTRPSNSGTTRLYHSRVNSHRFTSEAPSWCGMRVDPLPSMGQKSRL